MKRKLSDQEFAWIESSLAKYPSISMFFRGATNTDWIMSELRKAREEKEYHIFLGFMGMFGSFFAWRMSEMFELVLTRGRTQHSKLQKKIKDTKTQLNFESLWFELDIATLLLKRGYAVEIEPLGKKGPDFKTQIAGHALYIEAKRLQQSADETTLFRGGLDLEKELQKMPCPIPVEVWITLQDYLPSKPDKERLLQEVGEALDKFGHGSSGTHSWDTIGHDGRVTAHVRFTRSDSDQSLFSVTGSRSFDQSAIAWAQAEKYFKGEQLPESSLNVLVMDVFWSYPEDHLEKAWQEFDKLSYADCLILCPRTGGWSGDIRSNTRFLLNEHRLQPFPNDVLNALKSAFSLTSFSPLVSQDVL